MDEFEKRLGQVPLFRACSKHELRRIARVADADSVEPGEVVVKKGDRGHDLFVILSGHAKVKSGQRSVASLGPGDYFGELAVLNPAPRTATVTAADAMEVLIVGSRELAALLSDVPVLARKLLVGMAQRLQEADALETA
jgi:CRP-like cAMP-binding protein